MNGDSSFLHTDSLPNGNPNTMSRNGTTSSSMETLHPMANTVNSSVAAPPHGLAAPYPQNVQMHMMVSPVPMNHSSTTTVGSTFARNARNAQNVGNIQNVGNLQNVGNVGNVGNATNLTNGSSASNQINQMRRPNHNRNASAPTLPSIPTATATPTSNQVAGYFKNNGVAPLIQSIPH